MNDYPNYNNYIMGSYCFPFISSLGIKIILNGHVILSTYNVDAVGIQARLIGVWLFVFSLIILYFVLIAIPKSISKERVKEVLCAFFKSPFFISWLVCLILIILSKTLKYPALISFGMLIICFLFQLSLNKKIVQIYLK